MKLIILQVLLIAVPGCAAADLRFGVAPTGRLGFGDTRFELAILGYDADSALVSGGSELIFPIDLVMGGLQFRMDLREDGRRAWTAEINLATALNDPASEMIDRDWDNVGRVEHLWSHTLSNVEGEAWEASLEVTRLLTATQATEFGLVAGVTLQKFKQRMVDLRGWQLYDDGDGAQVYIFEDDDLAGTYEVRYARPEVGLVTRWEAGPFLTELQATLSPLIYVKDIDDHVRRGFQIRTDGRGLGAGSSLTLRWESPAGSSSRPFVALSGDYFRSEIDTDGTRNYYVDVAELGIYRGDRFAESHRITTTQYGLRLAVGLAF